MPTREEIEAINERAREVLKSRGDAANIVPYFGYIDVNIYEVSKNDLLQIGNQFTTESGSGNSVNLGALGALVVKLFMVELVYE